MFVFLINLYHLSIAFFSALFYRFPSRSIKVIGITGTSGKSTVADLTVAILKESGCRIALLSTIRMLTGEKEEPNLFKMTMPGRGQVQRFLRKAVDNGCQYAIIEVTSEGVIQYRHKFINFDTAVFTNIYPEHIERHGGFENYRAAKGEFFKIAKNIHILNLDDRNVGYFLRFPAKKKFGFTLGQNDSSPAKKNIKIIKASGCKEEMDGVSFEIGNFSFRLKIFGAFNIQNAMVSICIALSQGVPLETSRKALEKVSVVPGRMEIVKEKPFRVVVDYAHTPDALYKVYQTLRTKNQQLKIARMICVLGSCGGGRDKWKRPKLGEIASRFCDKVIITNEDPYDEEPMQIINEVFSGLTEKGKTFSLKILDRREAIKNALLSAENGDTVVITGKGCEPWICFKNGRKTPWDDRKIASEILHSLPR
ncbi:MAG: UDP-N-acetylmuramoyl-L-alanyl-D-glutamate--2,6-diaminopimelate ligase [Patescibacteria group bacterium]